ncbi:MAG: hypothetical protein NC200_01710 [Candidatus Gastranaerophilales bacterium]|nr:hypothetical protein [Candidatus Gastranaerophilales bacterium]
MAKIRRLNCFDKPKLKELISFLKGNDGNHFIDVLTNGMPGYLHYYLPLKYKFLDESYILTDKKRVLGLISANTFSGNHKKINISQLFFVENAYEVAQQLIEFIIAQYGAQGVHTFYVLVDDIYTELASVFVNSCGFRQCSYEQIWEASKLSFKKNTSLKYRRFKKSDVKDISDIYNDSVITHFKPTLERKEKEFCETLCSGLKYLSEYRYIIEDDLKVIGYFKISTADNENFTVDLNYSNGYAVDCETILYFATREILKRKRKFKLFVKMKNYLNTNKEQEKYLNETGFRCVKTKLLLVKDFFRIAKEFSTEERFAMLGGLHNSPTF